MPMPPYEVLCTGGCGRPAVYKVAARWSDGVTQELKTYALACADCLSGLFPAARRKQGQCRRAPGETLEPPGVFRLQRGHRDQVLERLMELESELDKRDPPG
jgi:hypothetical protein